MPIGADLPMWHDRGGRGEGEGMMTDWDAIRPREVAVEVPPPVDAELRYIGRIRTPFATRDDCPRRGSLDGPLCTLLLDDVWVPALAGLSAGMRIEVLYWMHLARRDLVLQSPRSDEKVFGTFALRSPVRPNPIATSICVIEQIEGGTIVVRGLECVDGTPLLDIKPERSGYEPKSLPTRGELP